MITYVPEEVMFEADADLPKLLVAPLYGNDPSYGVREMTQNAVDACKEREFEETKNGNIFSPRIQIGILKEEDKTLFVVKDNGKGMTLTELRKYFLRAGSSFRKSLDWQIRYTDDDGKPQIQRNGRFGVGVLSTFLLGNVIYVETRSMYGDVGYSFNAQIDSEQIEINKREDLEIGTFIKVLINDNTIKNLNSPKTKKWHEWYVLKSPLIEYINELDINFKPTNLSFPNDKDKLPLQWNCIKPSGFDKVLWTYDEKYKKDKFSCNGIVIPSEPNLGLPLKYSRGEYSRKAIISAIPTISIFDYDGVLPLTLNRNSVDGQLSFSQDLMKEIYKDIISCLLCFKQTSYIEGNSMRLTNQNFLHSSFKTNDRQHYSTPNEILYLNEGFILNYGYFINKILPKKLFTIFFKKNELKVNIMNGVSEDCVFRLEVKDKIRLSYSQDISDPGESWSVGGRVTMRREDYNALFDINKARVRKGLKQSHKIEISNEDWITYLNNYTGGIQNEIISAITTLDELIAIQEIPLKKEESDATFDKLLEHYIGTNVVIPYNIDQRRVKFSSAFVELEEYCAKYLINEKR